MASEAVVYIQCPDLGTQEAVPAQDSGSFSCILTAELET